MKRKYETLEEAIAIYTKYAECIPEEADMVEMYHRYRNEWKGYNGFLDWLIYQEEPCSKCAETVPLRGRPPEPPHRC